MKRALTLAATIAVLAVLPAAALSSGAPAPAANATAPAPAAVTPAHVPAPSPPGSAAKATPPAPPTAAAPSVSAKTSSSPFKGPLQPAQTSDAVRIALLLTLLTLIPALAICMTPFVRIVVVLSMIRHAFGMPETPPNQVLVVLALFLTSFVMMPTFARVNESALQPFLDGTISVQQAVNQGSGPLREFMLRQVHDSDIQTVYEISRQPLPGRAADVGLMQLTSAFMLNELRVSFKIGFVVMLPFLLIDLVVSSILLSLGMIMVPPTTLSLPIKVLMFVLIDGWSLVLEGVVGSFK
ncbi:MAG TPA: flagellar type III secretion system pore protein FliP [Caulobacteraceae bacterium]